MKRIISSMSVLSLSLGLCIFITIAALSPKIGTAVVHAKSQDGNSFSSVIPNSFSEKQLQLLNFAHTVSREDGNSSPEILQAVILQESLAGGLKTYRVANAGGKQPYFGVAQIKLVAAKDVISAYPALLEKYKFQTKTDEEIMAHLILNDEFNIEVASKYLKILKDDYGFADNVVLAAAYNAGPAGAKAGGGKSYAQSVMKYVQELKNKL